MSYSTTKTDLINKHEALKISFTVLNQKREAVDKVLSEVNVFIDSNPDDIEYRVTKNELIDKQHTITSNLSYVLEQMEATKKAIDNLDIGKAHNDWLHTPENMAFDRRFNHVMSGWSSGIRVDPQKRSVAVDTERQDDLARRKARSKRYHWMASGGHVPE